MAAEGMQPFTLEEHRKFMDALEVPSEGVTGKEWERIATCVGGNRTLMEVKLHAYEYFVRLTRHCKSDPLTHCKWSAQEDFTFEQGLAEFPEGDENRWERIAAMLPGKTAEDVQERYAKLVLDITRINNGDDIVIHYEGPLNDSFQGPIERDAATTTLLDGNDTELHEGTDGGCDDATISTYADDATKADEKTMAGESSKSCSPSVHGTGDEAGTEGEDGEDMMELDSVMNASMAVSSTGSTPQVAMNEGEGAAGVAQDHETEGTLGMSTEAEEAATVSMITEDQEAVNSTVAGDDGWGVGQAVVEQEGGEEEHAAAVMASGAAEAPEEGVEAREPEPVAPEAVAPEPVVSVPAPVNEAPVDTKVQTDEHLGLYAEAE